MSYGKLLLETRRKEIEKQNLETCKSKNETYKKNKATEEACKKIQEKKDNVFNKKKSYMESVIELKKSLLSECIYTIFDNSLPKRPMYESNDINDIKRNMVNTFIEENGMVNILNNFKYKSYILSELARIIEESIDLALMEAKNDKSESIAIDLSSEVKDTFYAQLKTNDIEDLSEIIRQRVMSGIEDFKITNANDKHDIQQAIQQSTEKSKDKSEKIQEACKTITKRKVTEIKNRGKKTIFESMVYNIAKSSASNDSMKERFFTESGLNMESVMEMTEVMYTFLETLNTSGMYNVNEAYIQKILKTQN